MALATSHPPSLSLGLQPIHGDRLWAFPPPPPALGEESESCNLTALRHPPFALPPPAPPAAAEVTALPRSPYTRPVCGSWLPPAGVWMSWLGIPGLPQPRPSAFWVRFGLPSDKVWLGAGRMDLVKPWHPRPAPALLAPPLLISSAHFCLFGVKAPVFLGVSSLHLLAGEPPHVLVGCGRGRHHLGLEWTHYQLSPEHSVKDREAGPARHCPRASPDPCPDPGREHLEEGRPQSPLLPPPGA